MTSMADYNIYKEKMQKIADVRYATAVLQWDQETYLPAQGATHRSRQVATLSELAHTMFTDAELGNLLNQLKTADLQPDERRNVDLSQEDYEKQTKFTPAFVRKMSEAVSAAFHAWVEARKQNDFSVFEPALTELVALKRQEAELLGYKEHPYDALLNEFEKGMTVQQLDAIFNGVKEPLRQLLQQVQQQPEPADDFLHQHFPKQQQWEWGMYLAKQLGFDFEAGRQDISEHPFTINFGSRDVRITTRIDEKDFTNMTWSTIHEVGHALYEQGLPEEMYGLPLGEYASLGIHESQSRLWENCVGRSKTFWKYYLPVLKQYFPEQLQEVELDAFVRAINKIKPSFIRTEADELTYHFHVIVRYELEKRLIEGSLQVKDIPSYWNEQYQQLLGVTVPGDKQGCLQDVHWGHGSFGYFPTYSLGSFYAAQLWKQALKELDGLEDEISNTGNCQRLLEWLRQKVHLHGRRYTSGELCELVTDEKLNSQIFLNYLQEKINSLQP
ncbi:carboxypeptidase M32 [Aridibaculum aurantiacum]|uniref:carboxypeptidase M32 n=1 Tax=Aridibaculum aurantiacum TaxID=2810307 RepID=UPI001A972DAB|nr:carboxypeptidase M32 [Aridibaculum aurantiacum]